MASPVDQRVKTRREAPRAAGLKPAQIRVPGARRPGFAEDCRRQSAVAAAADARDPDLDSALDAALDELVDEGRP